MATQFLRRFFAPRSLVVIGASPRPESIGGVVLNNVLEAGFPGPVWAVNPRGYDSVHGVACYRRESELPEVPELAIVCSPLKSVPTVLTRLSAFGVRAALVLSGGVSTDEGAGVETLRQRLQRAALASGMRIMGPECLGIAVPSTRLNATYAGQPIADGNVAYLGQSGMLGNAMIDWAAGRDVGFSHLVTLGDSVDVQLADVIDYLNQSTRCRSLLLHLESIRNARHFMTAIREASRNRLVLAIKSGRTAEATLDALPPTPGIAQRDEVVDAALARAGVVRVEDSDELFDALETLSRFKPPRSDRLAIVSNGVGPALLAIDKLIEGGGQLAVLSDETARGLVSASLDRSRPGQNPVDLGGSARPADFIAALELVTRDPGVDAVLMLHAPTRLAPARETAEALVEAVSRFRHRVLVSWMGLKEALAGRSVCNRAGVPSYISPEKAVRAFLHLARYRRVQRLLQETPPSLPLAAGTDARERCHALIDEALARDRDHLTHQETGEVLAAYGISSAPSLYAADLEAVEHATARLCGPWAVKAVHSGNCLPFRDQRESSLPASSLIQDIEQPGAVVDAVVRLGERVARENPGSSLYSYCLQTMQRGKQSLQLCAGITRDAEFGPVIVFGVGGYKVDVMADRQIALPPLNLRLAKELVERTHAGDLIREHAGDPELALDQVCRMLVKLSQMIADLPRLRGLEINPLLLNADGITAVDYALDLGPVTVQAIMPYPEELAETVMLAGLSIEIRPIRGEDAPLITHFHTFLSEQSIRYRYFHHKAVLSPRELAQLSQINYDRQMAFIAVTRRDDREEMLGVVRVWNDADNIRTEFSIIVRDDFHGIGLGRLLMEKIIRYSRQAGTLAMTGTILADNLPMRHLLVGLGFVLKSNIEEGVIEATLELNAPRSDWQRHRLEAAMD
ncbi:bifunctional acetate--CoA ligase family protein/GNAT family N-acetyltransferase [Salinicola rhizosphaerae]|uniref:GCN5 family N-acetyltransferase n=1 Tax=Salinicola rhizosphaerae TaxID=1443141 RepID=A0ABQ3DVE0_9GAMM|nr:bifunctional acetate--CoA ligase family protein/GNAT family N-acetyltransferase [Salinicola rhizosphaerae]GHB09050.1 GCN5 family N-acetyltransferase [Salinicola rhizosphaerae]